jgi:hypothetical protein
LQDPQHDNIRDAGDLILAPDSMDYYREQKGQEKEKEKREQAIAGSLMEFARRVDIEQPRIMTAWDLEKAGLGPNVSGFRSEFDEGRRYENSGVTSAIGMMSFTCVGMMVRNSHERKESVAMYRCNDSQQLYSINLATL